MCYVTSDFIIKQSVQVNAFRENLSGEELARQISSVLSTELRILLTAVIRDRASVNSVAMRTVSVVYNRVIDVGCFSHTVDRVGEHMKVPVLNEFSRLWIKFFAPSPKSRLIRRNLTVA